MIELRFERFIGRHESGEKSINISGGKYDKKQKKLM